MVSEVALAFVGEAFLSSFFEEFFHKLLNSLPNLSEKAELKEEDLQKLKILMLTVEKALGDAEQKQIVNTRVQELLDNLKEAAFDVEDLFDAIAVEGSVQEEAKKFSLRLENIIKKLGIIVDEKNIYNLNEGLAYVKSIPRLPATTSLLDKSDVCFRNDEKVKLIDILLSHSSDDKRIPVIAIVGMAGIGKSTLARFLYNDTRVQYYFNLGAWVHVSEEFDVFKVNKSIYEAFTLEHSDNQDLNVLQMKLQRTLVGKKFLLVLDNVWNERFREWDLLLRPLQVGAPGSKIIVTTRSQGVSSIMYGAFVHNLKMLPIEDSWSLFKKHAFRDRDPDEDTILKKIGDKIVRKCNGLPLAIITYGSLLCSERDAEEWNYVLHSRIWDLPYHQNDILAALRLSYHYLPSQLKRCFVYCSIFPKGHTFEKRDLIRLWIAEGLVQQQNNRRRLEDVGEQYFNELLSKSIFQQIGHEQPRFVMHDFFNDLAQHI